VKRRDLERHLRDHGVELLREGGKHTCRDLGIPPPTSLG
jgi:hypothetical protein